MTKLTNQKADVVLVAHLGLLVERDEMGYGLELQARQGSGLVRLLFNDQLLLNPLQKLAPGDWHVWRGVAGRHGCATVTKRDDETGAELGTVVLVLLLVLGSRLGLGLIARLRLVC